MTKRGRFIRYDKQRVLEEIAGGRKSAAEIAEAHGISRGMVYTLKYQAKKRNLIRDPAVRLDDLDPVEARRFDERLPNLIFQLAERYRRGELEPLEFHGEVRKLLERA